MKNKLVIILALCVSLCVVILGLNALINGKPEHEHVFNQEIAVAEFIATDATCTEKAKYYYSCACGASDTKTFEYGSFLGHDYGDGISNGDDTHNKTCANDNTHILTEQCSGGVATCIEKATCEVCNVVYGDFGTCDYVNGICIICGDIIGTDGLQYALINNDAEYAVTAYTGNSTEVYIPETHNNLPVTLIGEYAFSNCSSLINIEIPESITSIGLYAFKDCTSLTNIEIPDSVNSINGGAFWNCSSLTNIEIPDDVLNISGSVFYNCTSLKSVSIGSGVTTISGCTFQGCTSLTSIIIPDSVTSIGEFAFSGCDAIEKVIMPTLAIGHIKSKSLKEVIITSGTSIVDFAFSGCTLLTSIEIPESVNSFGSESFSNCSALKSIKIPNNINYIGRNAFNGCNSLEKVSMPSVVIEHIPKEKLKEIIITKGSIGESAFRNCTSLISVVTNDKVTSIGRYTFSGCTSLKSVEIAEGLTSIDYAAFGGCSALTSIGIPESVISIEEWAFSGCDSLKFNEIDGLKYLGNNENKYLYLVGCDYNVTTANIDGNCKIIDSRAFYNCNLLESIIVDDNNTNYKSIDGNLYSKDGKTLIQYSIGKSATLFIIPEGVTSIGNYAFSDCGSLTNIIILDNVTTIGNSSFSNCYSLKSVSIGNGVTVIGDYAFASCTLLENIIIGNSVSSIGIGTFGSCSSLTSIIIPNGVTSMAWDVFYGCSMLTSICCEAESQPNGWDSNWSGDCSAQVVWEYKVEQTVTEGLEFLLNETNMEYKVIGYTGTESEVYIPEKHNNIPVVSIENNAFSGSVSLVSVFIPSSVTHVGNEAFFNCDLLENIEVDNNNNYYRSWDGNLYSKDLKTLIKYAEGKTTTSFVIPNSVTSIGDYAFFDCETLESVIIPETVTAIGTGAFNYCTSLTSINIPQNIYMISIGSGVFANCTSLKSIYIPSNIQSIDNYAFTGCSSLETIVIPNSVLYIGRGVFNYCRSLTTIYCQAESVPSGWSSYWKENCAAPVVWGYKGN